jgi:hypothetical protein
LSALSAVSASSGSRRGSDPRSCRRCRCCHEHRSPCRSWTDRADNPCRCCRASTAPGREAIPAAPPRRPTSRRLRAPLARAPAVPRTKRTSSSGIPSSFDRSGARVETGRASAIDAGEHADTRPAGKEPSVRRPPLCFARIGERFQRGSTSVLQPQRRSAVQQERATKRSEPRGLGGRHKDRLLTAANQRTTQRPPCRPKRGSP